MKKSKGSTKKSRREEPEGLPPCPPGKKQLQRKAKARARAEAKKRGPETLEQLLERLSIEDWDFVIVGDGSGSNYNHECGWGSVSIERLTGERQIWAGLMNRGTVNIAEAMAYLQPLNWIVAREEERRKKSRTRRTAYKIHIVTDSQYCRDRGSSSDRMRAKNAVLWDVMESFRRQGFVLHWHWIDRDTADLNVFADRLSKMARKLAKQYNFRDKMERDGDGDVVRTVYDVNPSSS